MASGRRLALRTHCDDWDPTPKSRMTLGSDSGTAVWSTNVIALADVIDNKTTVRLFIAF
jgi:hypothetical protein